MTDLNIKQETIKLLEQEKKMGENCEIPGIGKYFLGWTGKAGDIKLDVIKIKTFCSLEDLVKEKKR